LRHHLNLEGGQALLNIGAEFENPDVSSDEKGEQPIADNISGIYRG
jgi:hypothetical protein